MGYRGLPRRSALLASTTALLLAPSVALSTPTAPAVAAAPTPHAAIAAATATTAKTKIASVKITGSFRVGSKLTAKVSAKGATKLTYQWSRDGKKIAGATKKAFTLRAKDRGKHRFSVKVTAKRPGAKASSKTAKTSKRSVAKALTASERNVLKYVNEARAKGWNCGVEGKFKPTGKLKWNSKVAKAAKSHSNDMKKHDFFSHTGSNGKSSAQRLTAAGYKWSRVGENIAWGQSTARAVVSAWLDSDGHCANIMNPKYTHLGLGVVKDSERRRIWTQMFATPR